MSLEQEMQNMVPCESAPDDLAEVRGNWEFGLEVVCEQEDVAYTLNRIGWRMRVVLRDSDGHFHCHRYQAWDARQGRLSCWTDYIGSDPVKVMKWLCGEEVE
jgi:hypothetical protein